MAEVRLNARDAQLLLEVTEELLAVERIGQLAEVILPAMLRLVAADAVGWNDIDLRRGVVTGAVLPDRAAERAFDGLNQIGPGEHPLIEHFALHPDSPATTMSDVCSSADWRSSELYRDIFRPFGWETQLAITFPGTPDRTAGVAFNRDARDFSERDRDVLTAARPFVHSTFRRLVRAEAREAAIVRLGDNAGWISVDRDGLVIDLGPAAADVAAGCHVRLEPGEPLPAFPKDVAVREVARDDGTVVVCVCPRSSAQELGLTQRQVEALRALAGGDTVAAAARRLDISPRTLAKHLENAYSALGVTNRVAALSRIRDAGLLS
jgi:DNA-binding CsgD family transcriptional regulator